MNVFLDPNSGIAVNKQAESSPAPSPRSTARPEVEGQTSPSVNASPAVRPPGSLLANITFRRDSNGRVFYVVTDPQSGQEIQELPPATVRAVGESLEEFLQAHQVKPQRVDVKG